LAKLAHTQNIAIKAEGVFQIAYPQHGVEKSHGLSLFRFESR
jgi:hypothetical protein